MQSTKHEFEEGAGKARTGLVKEFVDFLRHNKKWWLLPIVLAMALIGILVLLGGSPAAPFIYQLF